MNADNNIMSGFFEGILIAITMFISSSMFLVVVFFVILWIILKWKLPVIKGKYGEWVVKSKLRKAKNDDVLKCTGFHGYCFRRAFN